MVLNAEIEQWEVQCESWIHPAAEELPPGSLQRTLEFASHEKWKVCEKFPWSIPHRTKLGTHMAEKKNIFIPT